MKALTHWRLQRYSAILLVPLSVWLILNLATLPHYDLTSIQAFTSNILSRIALALTIVIGLFHAQMGIEVIAEDYVPNPSKRAIIVKFSLFIVLFCSALLVIALASTL